MQGDLIVVFGGSGFIGRHVIKALARRGKRVRAPMRRPHLGADLRVMGDVGQIQLVQANVRYPESVERALDGASGVVNLIGLLYEKGVQSFSGVQVGGARAIAQAAAARGIERFVQVSAIGADPHARSAYARTKAEAEAAVREAVPSATILRPSIVFGPEDDFFNRFGRMAKYSPALPLIGGGRTRFQPIHVQDVAEAIASAIDMPQARGRSYELGGPRAYTFKELLRFVMETTHRKRALVPIPFGMAKLMGAAAGAAFAPLPLAPPLTADQVELLKADNVVGVSGDPRMGTIADLGVTDLETIEAIVPTYLWTFRPYGQFQTSQPA